MEPKFHFDTSLIPTFLQNIKAGNCSLFLGAGVSRGATVNGRDLPGGDELAEMLIDFAQLSIKGKHKLQSIYDAACSKMKSSSYVNDFIKQKLIRSEASWQSIIPIFLWKIIYTTNIDDVLVSALKKCKKPVQNFIYKCHKDYYQYSPQDIDEAFVVHLHGYVRKDQFGYIFGHKEYAATIKERLAWHIKFADDFSHGKFLFVGTRFDEPDLDAYISYREKASSYDRTNLCDSFLVTTSIDDVVINRMRYNGVLCIEASANDFFSWLADQIKINEKRSVILSKLLPPIASQKSDDAKKSWIAFTSQFNVLNTNNFDEPDPDFHDFFNGDMPTWNDIKNNNDARLSIIDKIITNISTDGIAIRAITGAAGCGKTTALMRIAWELKSLDCYVFFFYDESYINVDHFINVISSIYNKNGFVFIDNAAEYIDQVDIIIHRLKSKYPENLNNIKFIIAERDNRFQRVTDAVRSIPINEFELNWINDDDIIAISEKLKQKDKLRSLRGKSKKEITKFFADHSEKQLLVAMREISSGGKFDDIIAKEYIDIQNKTLQSIYATVALCHYRNFTININIINRIFESQISHEDLMKEIKSGTLKRVVIYKDKRLSTRHPIIAQQLFFNDKLNSTLSRKNKAQLIINLMIAIAPYVNVEELSKGSSLSKIVKNIMDYDNIDNIIGRDNESIEKFFIDLKDHYEWNSKYWAQRALFESSRSKFNDALDYANYAVKLDDHWSITTARSTVLFKASLCKKIYNFNSSYLMFKESIDSFINVIKERNYNTPIEIKSIFVNFIQFYDTWKSETLVSFFELFNKCYTNITSNRALTPELKKFIDEKRTELLAKRAAK
jgi:hypothetical protein